MTTHLFESNQHRRDRVMREYRLKREMSLLPPARRQESAARDTRLRSLKWASVVLAALFGMWLASRATAAGFEVAASPARFELSGMSSKRMGQSLDIHNLGNSATEVSVRTLDWTYSEEGKLGFHDELLPRSCRPWVTLERKVVQVPARSKKTFRFQIDPPADAPRGQCRFMLAIEGVNPAHKALIESGTGASLALPVNGRIAVAVYYNVNGAEPKLELREVKMAEINGKRVPAVRVHNAGDAHGRLDGSLDAKDARGTEFELVPDGTPILPGQTRLIALSPKADAKTPPPAPAYPLASKGTLDWDRGSFKISAEFRQ